MAFDSLTSSNYSTVAPKHALVVCDMQPDFLKSITPESRRMALLDAVQISVHTARLANWPILFYCLEFKPGYEGVSPHDTVYGALARLNAKLGDAQVHWFMEGYEGSKILPSLVTAASINDDDCTIIRRRHQHHFPQQQLVNVLKEQEISHVTVVGCKAGYSIQAVCQVFCDQGFQVSVVRECVGDDDENRLAAVMQHLIPIYATVVGLVDYVDQAVTIEDYVDRPKDECDLQDFQSALVQYCCDCGRGGHASLYIFYLLQRTEWQLFPRQQWYVDFIDTYFCPLGKRVIHFCDEPQFSLVSMYLKGREWLDEKEKLVQLAGNVMPETFLIKRRQWIGETPPGLNDEFIVDKTCWFVKDVNKNGGRAVQMCNHVSECMNLTEPDEVYVVQRHVADPLLTDDGCKCHIKFYSLLHCNEHGVWDLYTYKDAFLSVSPNQWSPNDVSKETQITVKRNKRLKFGQAVEGWQTHESVWPAAYDKCKEAVTVIVGNAIAQGKLQTRPNKKQFEIFSADFMLDTSGKLWIIEFNFSPVLYDPKFANDENLTTPGLKKYHELYLKQGEEAEVNDGEMIRDAVTIAFDDGKGLSATTKWDAAGQFRGSDCDDEGASDAYCSTTTANNP